MDENEELMERLINILSNEDYENRIQEIERIIDFFSSHQDEEHLVDILEAIISNHGPCFREALRALIGLSEEKITDRSLSALGGALEPSLEDYYDGDMVTAVDDNYRRHNKFVNEIRDTIRNILEGSENSLAPKFKSVLKEIKKREEHQQKENFYRLLEKINEGRRLNSSENDELMDCFNFVSLSPTEPIHLPPECEGLANGGMLAQWREVLANFAQNNLIDNRICRLLSRILVNNSAIRWRVAKTLFLKTEWPQNSETASLLATYLIYAFREEWGEDLNEVFVEAMGRIINFSQELQEFLLNLIKEDCKENATLRKKIVNSLAALESPTEKIIKSLFIMLKYSETKKREKHEREEEELIDALAEALGKYALRHSNQFKLIGKEFLKFCSFETKLKLANAFLSSNEKVLSMVFEDDEVVKLKQTIEERKIKQEFYKSLDLTVKAFYQDDFEKVIALLDEKRITNEDFIKRLIDWLRNDCHMEHKIKKLLNVKPILSDDNIKDLIACCKGHFKKFSFNAEKGIDIAESLLLLNPEDEESLQFLIEKLFDIPYSKNVAKVFGSISINNNIVEVLKDLERIKKFIVEHSGQSEQIEGFIVNLCKHEEYKNLVLSVVEKTIIETQALINKKDVVKDELEKFKINANLNQLISFVLPTLYNALAHVDLIDVESNSFIMQFALANFMNQEIKTSQFLRAQIARVSNIIVPTLIQHVFYSELNHALHAALILAESSTDKGSAIIFPLVNKLLTSTVDSLEQIRDVFSGVLIKLVKYETEKADLVSLLKRFQTSNDLQKNILAECVGLLEKTSSNTQQPIIEDNKKAANQNEKDRLEKLEWFKKQMLGCVKRKTESISSSTASVEEDYKQRKDPISLDNHWYSDDEINLLLKHYFGHKENINLMAGINANLHNGETLLDNLNQIQFQQTLEQSVSGETQDTIIVPINFGNMHWCALHIYFNQEDRMAPTVGYFDPLGQQMPEVLKTILKKVFINLDMDKILVSPIKLQMDSYNCGPWVVAILEYLVTQHGLPPTEFDIRKARELQQEILTNLDQKDPQPSSLVGNVKTKNYNREAAAGQPPNQKELAKNESNDKTTRIEITRPENQSSTPAVINEIKQQYVDLNSKVEALSEKTDKGFASVISLLTSLLANRNVNTSNISSLPEQSSNIAQPQAAVTPQFLLHVEQAGTNLSSLVAARQGSEAESSRP